MINIIGQESVSYFCTQLIIFYFKGNICCIISFQNNLSYHLCKLKYPKESCILYLQIYDECKSFSYWHSISMPAYTVLPAQNPGTSLTFLQRTEWFEDTSACMTRGARKHFTSSACVLKQKLVQARRQAD